MPYIIEGAIVGLISALCAWGISTGIYNAIYVNTMKSISKESFYALINTSRITWPILILVAFIGVMIGAIGSGISVRKYIKV